MLSVFAVAPIVPGQYGAVASSALTVPISPASAFSVPCGSLCSPAGP